jgi:glycosyltransferase involved in cell wall biosynthesis
MTELRRASLGILTQGRDIPSTRFRLGQHVNSLLDYNIDAHFLHSTSGAYPPKAGAKRPAWLASGLIDGWRRAQAANQFDIRILQRELISTLYTVEGALKSPFLFDVDDAIFLNSRFRAADRLAKRASLTICGNDFLANHFSAFGAVEVLPTAVDTARFKPAGTSALGPPVIGWSGSSGGFHYLYSVEMALARVLQANPDAVLMIIADRAPQFSLIPAERVVFKQWTPETEVLDLLQFTVGIMPLIDGIWERGKCSFKMLTYMSAGIPVVVSPVGMNIEVLAKGPCGHAALSLDDWVGALESALADSTASRAMGACGRKIVEEFYSAEVIGRKLAKVIRSQLR